MINPQHDLTISRQAKLLALSRGSVYYVPRAISEADLNRTYWQVKCAQFANGSAVAGWLDDVICL